MIALARAQKRPVYLALLLYGQQAHQAGDPQALASAMRSAVKTSCTPPDPTAVIATRQASFDFRQGRRRQARAALEQVLSKAEKRGLVVPRQRYELRQHSGTKVFNLEQSMSLGGHLLKGTGKLQVGLGYQAVEDADLALQVSFADPHSSDSAAEAARYYAHAASLLAVYHFVEGAEDEAVGRSPPRRAKRGPTVCASVALPCPLRGGAASGSPMPSVSSPSRPQQAADSGNALLAGDLWTLYLLGLGSEADDEAVVATLKPLPTPLRGIAELEAVAARASRSVETLTAKLTCTTRPGAAQQFQRVSCKAYPLALSLRVADGLAVLPRLKAGAAAAQGCAAWGAVRPLFARRPAAALRARQVPRCGRQAGRRRKDPRCSGLADAASAIPTIARRPS